MDDFEARCRRALSIVQRDLDATGYTELHMSPRNLSIRGPTRMYAALPNGDSWSGGDNGMTEEMTEEVLLYVAAMSVTDTLFEVLRITWPVCSSHGGQLWSHAGATLKRGGGVDMARATHRGSSG